MEILGGYLAYLNRCLELVKNLIKNTNLNINIQNNYGETVFHYACMYGDLAIVEFFKVLVFLGLCFVLYRKGLSTSCSRKT